MKFSKTFVMLMLFFSFLFIGKTYADGNGNTITLGVTIPLSGSHAAKGTAMLRAVQMYIENINKNNGINGKKVDIVIEDDKNTPEGAREAALKLVKNKKITGIIGHYYSSSLMAAAKIYDEAGIPVISPYSSNSVIAKSKWLFSINVGDEDQGKFMAVYLNKILNKKNVLLIHTDDPYGMGLKNGFTGKAQKLNITVNKTLSFNQRESISDDYIAKNLKIAEIAKIESVVILTHSREGLKLVKQIRDFGIKTLILGPNTFSSNVFIKDLPESYTRDVYVTSPFLWELATETAYNFSVAYKNKFNEAPDITSVMAYDAALLMLEAIKSKGNDKEKIRDYLVSIKWQTAVEGMTGLLLFSSGRTMDRDIYVSEIKDGRFKSAYTQLSIPKEPYILKQLPERIKKGYIIMADDIPYHVIDVVFCGLDYFRINMINPQKLAYDIEFFIWYKWMGKSVEIKNIDIINGIYGVEDQTIQLKEDLSRPVKYRVYKIKGTYLTPFDMKKFPFDTQTLPMVISDKIRHSKHIMLALDTRHMEGGAIDIYNPEYTYVSRNAYSSLYRYHTTFGDPDYRMGTGYKSKIYFSTIKANIIIKRNIFSYIFTLFLPLAIVLIISLLVFAVPVDNFGERLSMAMTALLSILIFHMSQKSTLPAVSYLMKVDYYFIFSYVFMMILVLFIIIISRFSKMDKENISRKVKILNRRFTWIFVPAVLLTYGFLTFMG